jgi:guanosine-3',5'-bis(diphosphate) 3'-pyrophosphohydrolase
MNIEVAIGIALKAHEGQIDKGGNPYVLHPLSVMTKVGSIHEKIVAVLHDVVEDSDMALEQLKQYGFSSEIVDAIDQLTKREGEPYDDFITRCKMNPISRKVKVADIRDNMDMTRMKEPGQKDFIRLEKYLRALSVLDENCPSGG